LIERLKHELNAEVFITKTAAQVASLLAADDSATSIAVFGGDGTIAEVVNNMDLSRQELLPLHGGTGNGLARDLGLTTLESSFSAVRDNNKKCIDVLAITVTTTEKETSRLVISATSFGYVTETVLLAKRMMRPLGSLRYLLALAIKAVTPNLFELTVCVDGNITSEKEISTVIINNTSHVGNIKLFSQASLCDQKMNMFLVKGTIWARLRSIPFFYGKGIPSEPPIEFDAQELIVETCKPMQFMIDGEIWQDVIKVRFNVLPGRLTCFAEG
jgi:diacylglycerol kinase family enzyme